MTTRNRNRHLTYEPVIELIKAQLLEGKLRPGDQLPTIAERAAHLGVSHGSVREAYRVLESRGILEVVQGRGTFVASTIGSSSEVLDRLRLTGNPTRAHLLEARRLLEPRAAALAAIRATRAERDAILRTVDEEEAKTLSVSEWVELNLKFHSLIVLAAHNPVISQMLTSIYELFKESEPHPAELPIVREKGRLFHRLIAFAIDDQDAESAEGLMYHHIESVERILATEELGK
ncbi:MAG: FCD domain-containing protein [Trueperaceae bacterium]